MFSTACSWGMGPGNWNEGPKHTPPKDFTSVPKGDSECSAWRVRFIFIFIFIFPFRFFLICFSCVGSSNGGLTRARLTFHLRIVSHPHEAGVMAPKLLWGAPICFMGLKNPLCPDPKLSPMPLKDQYALAPDPISPELFSSIGLV